MLYTIVKKCSNFDDDEDENNEANPEAIIKSENK